MVPALSESWAALSPDFGTFGARSVELTFNHSSDEYTAGARLKGKLELKNTDTNKTDELACTWRGDYGICSVGKPKPLSCSEHALRLQEHAEHLQDLVSQGKLDGALAETFLADTGAKREPWKVSGIAGAKAQRKRPQDSVLEAGADAEALRLLQGRAARRSFAVEFADSALATASADFDSTGLQQIGSRTVVWKHRTSSDGNRAVLQEYQHVWLCFGAADPRFVCGKLVSIVALGLLKPRRKTLMALPMLSAAGASDMSSVRGICVEWLARGQLHRTLISLLLIAECLTSATYTVVVPLSYDLATHLGQGSAFSGLMVSAPFAVYLAGALRARWVMMSWNQAKICTYIVGAYAIYVLSTALCAAVVHPPAFLFLSGNATLRASLLLVLRMSYGLVDSVGDVMQMNLRVEPVSGDSGWMVVKVSPQEELRELMVSIFASNALGFGLGPLLSGAIGEVVQVSDLELRACIPLIVLALLWTALLLAIRSNLPLELSEAETGLGRQDTACNRFGDSDAPAKGTKLCWHDMVQYHFFFEDMFVQARAFLTPSVEEHSLWIFDHSQQKVQELENCSQPLQQAEVDYLHVSGPRMQIEDGDGGGRVSLDREELQQLFVRLRHYCTVCPADLSSRAIRQELVVDFKSRNVFSWLPAGQQDDAVIHRPDLEITMKHGGRTRVGRGYSKRYFGHYGPHWGYRFIQSSWLSGGKTADATFRLGDGEERNAKYNYFKLLDGDTNELVQADSRDTYQQDSFLEGLRSDTEAHAWIGGERYVASITPLGEWLHDYKKGETNSRMQLRYCSIKLQYGDETLQGYALNERCFGDVDGVDDADPDDSICESGDLALSRRIIFWAGLIYALICAALTSSLEAQTALVLERQLHFSAQSIGLLLGSAFCATAPLTVMLSWLPTEIERPWPICVALPPMLATVFLFKGTCVFLGLGELRHWAMLAADVVLFSVALCANGIVDATALQHAGGTRLYCRENYVIAAATLRAAGSFLGPPAAMQLVLVLLAIVSVAMIKSLGAWLHDTEADLLAAQCRLKDKVVSHRE
eukprot:s1424_g2.t1